MAKPLDEANHPVIRGESQEDRNRRLKREYYQANRHRWKSYQDRRTGNGRHRDTYLRRRYGITAAAYDAMHEAQSGLCAICAQPETRMQRGQVMPLCVDHDHDTGAVRALLCHACNTLIGHANEDPLVLAQAIEYLGVHGGQ